MRIFFRRVVSARRRACINLVSIGWQIDDWRSVAKGGRTKFSRNHSGKVSGKNIYDRINIIIRRIMRALSQSCRVFGAYRADSNARSCETRRDISWFSHFIVTTFTHHDQRYVSRRLFRLYISSLRNFRFPLADAQSFSKYLSSIHEFLVYHLVDVQSSRVRGYGVASCC